MTLRFPETVEHDLAKQALARLIEQSFEQTAAHTTGPRAIRVEVPIEDVDPLAWLEAQGNRSRGYWRERDGEFELAGVGTADIFSAEAECDYDELLSSLRAGISTVHPNLRYLGGMRFSQRAAIEPKWKPFGAYRFVLPRFEVFNRGAQSYLACNAIVDEQHDELLASILEGLEAMPFPGNVTEGPLPSLVSRTDTPDKARWNEEIGRALSAFERGPLKKVVLARETRFTFTGAIDPVALLRRLERKAQNSYCFCFQPKPDTAFIGVSPERLYKRQSRYLRGEALAGTRPRGATDAEDSALTADLLSNEKDRREHRFVLDAVCANFEARCRAVYVDGEVSVRKLDRIQHLYAHVEGILEYDNTDAELLRELHPTPAVGGVPKQQAIEWINQAESFDRGWYAGPIGWVGIDAAEFAVGIRSALVSRDTLSVYAGAGIVPGSQPDAEWAEIENKISHVIAALPQT